MEPPQSAGHWDNSFVGSGWYVACLGKNFVNFDQCEKSRIPIGVSDPK